MRPCSAWVHDDIFTKLSFLIWGLGYIGHGQLIKALLVTVVQGLGLYFLGTSGVPALKKFGTLGTVQMEMKFNPLTLKNEVNDYDNSFAILLLSVIAMVVIVPLFILIAVAFTNYDQQHMPPASLFTWVGLANFAALFGGQSLSLTFNYAFAKVLNWTLVWAFFATFTTFFGGVFLAMLINDKKTKCPKLWRTLFMITIAVPQFVTLRTRWRSSRAGS